MVKFIESDVLVVVCAVVNKFRGFGFLDVN